MKHKSNPAFKLFIVRLTIVLLAMLLLSIAPSGALSFRQHKATGSLALLASHTSRNETTGCAISHISLKPQCSYCISPLSNSFTHESGSDSIVVTTPMGCTWSAVSNNAWITINSGAIGIGGGTVNYSVAANITGNRRTGTITVAGETFNVVQGIAFNDVPADHPFYAVIGKLSGRGITLGCSANPALYCPDQPVTREQMAAFIMRALGEFNPPTPATQRFADVPPGNPFYAFIDRLAELGITLGCGNGNYCPGASVTREQMAAFMIRARGEFAPPIPPLQRFDDTPPSNTFYAFIDRMAVLGITLGCSAVPPLYCPASFVTRGQMAAFLIRAFDQPINLPPTVSAGLDSTISLSTMANLSGTVTDDGFPYCSTLNRLWSKVSGPGTVTFGDSTQEATSATFSAAGTYVLRLTVSDSQLSAIDEITVIVNQPPTVNAGVDTIITLPNSANLAGTVSDDGLPNNTLTVSWSLFTGPAPVILGNANAVSTTAIFSVPGIYTMRLTADDTHVTSSDDVVVTVNADPTPPPPDPITVAPPLDMTVATTIGTATAFLYTGANPIQTGVAPGTIKPTRAAVLRGRVLNKNNAPLPLVKITVLNHPEFGQTMSRADGRFDMAVNGGEVLTVDYEKVGFLPLQRTENIPWQDYVSVPDVVMMNYDSNVTFIDLDSIVPIQLAQGTTSSDGSGTRRTALLFKSGTTATMKLPGGGVQGLDKLHVRATEFTVGANGVNAMPGELPANSGYTYAVEYSLDEAVAAGAIETTFSQPVVQYNENFLNFPVGIDIPSGAYDRVTGQWVPSASGRVVKILSITSGTANLDVNGNGMLATDPEYASLGINIAERQQIATLYSLNQSLWRVPIIHFTPWDCNWPVAAPGDAVTPPGAPASGDATPDDQDSCRGCFTIGMQSQTLGEALSLVGSPFTLRYSSDRKTGRVAARSLAIPLSGPSLPASLKRIELTVTVAGRTFSQTLTTQINQSTIFTWDGFDSYGRAMQGKQAAKITVGYVYDGVYQRSVRFAYNGNGISVTGDPTRQEIMLAQVTEREIGAFDDRALALGGWSLDVHHFYDPLDHTLYEGDGSRRTVDTINATITTVAGNDNVGFISDNVPAVSTSFFYPFSATVAPNGELYVADSQNRRVRKVDLNGIVTTVVGTGANCAGILPCGDGGQAVNAQLNFATDVAIGANGALYIFDARAFRVRKVTADGVITTVVGNGQTCPDPTSGCGDGGPATQARLSTTDICCRGELDVAADGALYLTDAGNHRVRRVGTDGIITTIAGNGNTAGGGSCTVVGTSPIIATSACLGEPLGLTVAPNGAVYFTDVVLNQIFHVTSDGFIRVVAGDGVCNDTGDGGPALNARMCLPHGIARGPDGALYFSDWNNARIRRIDANGMITNYAGTGGLGFSGDGGPATAAEMLQSLSVSFGADGAIYIGEANNHRIRRVSPPLPGFSNTEIAVSSRNGKELFKFNSAGRHLQTINTLTGAVKYTFGYDGAGRLITITDGDSKVTTIQRNGAGQPTGILSPFNQLTTFTLDANGYFATITNPASEQYQFTYNAGGLMTLKRDPRNNQTVFTYDSLGRLKRDDDAASGFQALTRSETGVNYSVTRNTALNQTSVFQVQQLGSGDRQRTTTLSSGLQETLLERQNGKSTMTWRDGTLANRTLGPDPRWRMQAPLRASTTVITPGNLAIDSSFARSVTLSTPGDPLSLTSKTDTLNLNGLIYTSAFTSANRTFVVTSPLNRQRTATIDMQGRLTSLQLGNLNSVTRTYDAQGRLATTVFGTGGGARTSTSAYNPGGFLASFTDPLNQVTGFAYDATGRVTQKTTPDSRTIGFGYDATGNLTSVTPPGRPAHNFTYNAVDFVATYTPPAVAGSGATQFSYSLDHQLTAITQPGGVTINYGYDTAGRVTTQTIAAGTSTFTYSGSTGNLTGLTAPSGPTLAFAYDGFLPTSQTWSGVIAGSVSQTFNNFFRRASQSVNGGNTVSFTYDDDNLLTGAGGLAITRDAQNGLVTGATLSNVSDTRGYNGFGELTSYSASFNATPLYSFGITRDKLGRVTQKVDAIGGLASTYDYTYDLAGRLQEVKLNSATISSYTYDSNNNRVSYNGTITGTYDNQDRMTAYAAATYGYTANGELSSKTIGVQTTTYSYDALGNLRNVTLPDTTQIAYVIDGLNRRTGKRVNGTLTQGWLYQDQLAPVAELDGSNNIVSRFVYGTRSNTPDYMIRGGVTYRIITDQVGSVRLVVDVATGNIAERIDYDEFGIVLQDTNPGFQPFGFAGGLYDSQTKLTRFGARDYDAETGRWTTKDPILFAGGDTNLYSYVANNPLNQIDPSGLDSGNAGGGSHGFVSGLPMIWPAFPELTQPKNPCPSCGDGGKDITSKTVFDKELDPNKYPWSVIETMGGLNVPHDLRDDDWHSGIEAAIDAIMDDYPRWYVAKCLGWSEGK